MAVTALVAGIVQPVLAYLLAEKASWAPYFAMIGSALVAIAYTISRMNVKTAWIAKAVEIAQTVGQELETPVEPPPLAPPPSETTARRQVEVAATHK